MGKHASVAGRLWLSFFVLTAKQPLRVSLAHQLVHLYPPRPSFFLNHSNPFPLPFYKSLTRDTIVHTVTNLTSRYNLPLRPIMSSAPYTPRHSRSHSPPLSVTTPSTVGPQTQRLNIVTRLAIEGDAKKTESVPIKMYMKVCRVVERYILISHILFHPEARSPSRQHYSWKRDPAL